MKYYIFVIIGFLIPSNSFGQDKLSQLVELPSELNETSALVFYDNLFWTINDSGGEPIIYGIDRNGIIQRRVEVEGAKNKDWEALALGSDHIFIGDFGNNFGSRNDLKIYAVKLEQLKSKSASIDFIIDFQYPEQTSWIKTKLKTQFDCEAMVVLNDKIHLFTKDWKNKLSAHYTLNIEDGFQNALFQRSLNTNGLVTDATYNNENFYFIGYSVFIPVIWHYNFENGFKLLQRVEFFNNAKYQVEGITYLNDTLFITTEKSEPEQSLLYYLAPK